MTTLPTTALPTEPTKRVYVEGSVYYDAGHGVEIQLTYDKDVTFEVPVDIDMDYPYAEPLAGLVQSHAIALIKRRLVGVGIKFNKNNWEMSTNTHDVIEE